MEFYQELQEALEALPKKRLITSVFEDNEGCYCAIGAMRRKRARAGQAFTMRVGVGHTINENDSFAGTPAERYAHMHAWAKEKRA